MENLNAERMSRDEQIEKMARSLCLLKNDTCEDCNMKEHCLMRNCAEGFYNAGYRKASDIAEEIFADLDNALGELAMKYSDEGLNEYFGVCEVVLTKVIYPIKKKYTGEG